MACKCVAQTEQVILAALLPCVSALPTEFHLCAMLIHFPHGQHRGTCMVEM